MNARLVGLLIIAVFVLPVALTTAADDKDKKEEAARPIKGWGMPVDPDGNCKIVGKESELAITILGSHHDLTYTEAYSKLNSPRVLQEVKGDFSVEVTVEKFELPKPDTSSGGDFSFVSNGLVVWQDDKSFLRFERAAEGNNPAPFLWIEHFVDGKSNSRNFTPLDDKDVSLKIERKGDGFTFLSKADGEVDWKEVHSANMKLARDAKVGVLAINTTTREFTAKFSKLKLASGK